MTLYQTRRMHRVLALFLTTILLAGPVATLAYGSAAALDPPGRDARGPSAQPVAPLPVEPQHDMYIMPVGDSMTLGYLSELDDDGIPNRIQFIGYRGHLQDLLDSGGYYYDFMGSRSHGPVYEDIDMNVYDCHHEGWGSMHADNPDATKDDVLGQIYGWLERVYKEDTEQLDAVLLQIGTNDINNGDTGKEVAQEVMGILDKIQAFARKKWDPGTTRVILALIINNHSPEGRDRPGRTKDYHRELREMALKRTDDVTLLTLVNMAEVVDDPEDYDEDKFHPLDSAYRKMASVWYRALDDECVGDGIYLYEGADYAGSCRKFTASDSDLALAGWARRASSIKFVGSYGWGNYVARLYPDAKFGGISTPFWADDPDLNDDAINKGQASSIEIDCAGDGIYLYEHRNFNKDEDLPYVIKPGWCRKFTASDPDLSLSVFDDVASSIKFAGSYSGGDFVAEVYRGYNFSGPSTAFSADNLDFADVIDDQASSIQITDLTPLPGPGDDSWVYVPMVTR